MSLINGQATSFNCPNYVGELFAASPEDTPFLSAIGGLTGGLPTASKLFEWQTYDLRDAAADRQAKEGANAPDATARARSHAYNVVEIHHEAVDVSYTKQAITRQRSTASLPAVTLGSTVIPADELAWQLDVQIKQIARDVEASFLQGTFANPSDNTSARKTRGLIAAIESNTATLASLDITDSTSVAGFELAVLNLFQKVWQSGGIRESETRTVIVNATLKRALTLAFLSHSAGRVETSRNVGGVTLQTFETDFGRANIMLDRYMPTNKLVVCSLEQCVPRFLEIPGKGHFFAEPLAKVGSSDRVQIYGEIGLQYGHEAAHGLLTVTSLADPLAGDESSDESSSPDESSPSSSTSPDESSPS